MGESPSRSDALRAFYDENLRALEFGNAVADVILVPILALNLVGWISIKGNIAPGLVAVFAFIPVSSTAILLVAGYLGDAFPRLACVECRGTMTPEFSAWTGNKCGARRRLHRVARRPKPMEEPDSEEA